MACSVKNDPWGAARDEHGQFKYWLLYAWCVPCVVGVYPPPSFQERAPLPWPLAYEYDVYKGRIPDAALYLAYCRLGAFNNIAQSQEIFWATPESLRRPIYGIIVRSATQVFRPRAFEMAAARFADTRPAQLEYLRQHHILIDVEGRVNDKEEKVDANT